MELPNPKDFEVPSTAAAIAKDGSESRSNNDGSTVGTMSLDVQPAKKKTMPQGVSPAMKKIEEDATRSIVPVRQNVVANFNSGGDRSQLRVIYSALPTAKVAQHQQVTVTGKKTAPRRVAAPMLAEESPHDLSQLNGECSSSPTTEPSDSDYEAEADTPLKDPKKRLTFSYPKEVPKAKSPAKVPIVARAGDQSMKQKVTASIPVPPLAPSAKVNSAPSKPLTSAPKTVVGVTKLSIMSSVKPAANINSRVNAPRGKVGLEADPAEQSEGDTADDDEDDDDDYIASPVEKKGGSWSAQFAKARSSPADSFVTNQSDDDDGDSEDDSDDDSDSQQDNTLMVLQAALVVYLLLFLSISCCANVGPNCSNQTKISEERDVKQKKKRILHAKAMDCQALDEHLQQWTTSIGADKGNRELASRTELENELVRYDEVVVLNTYSLTAQFFQAHLESLMLESSELNIAFEGTKRKFDEDGDERSRGLLLARYGQVNCSIRTFGPSPMSLGLKQI